MEHERPRPRALLAAAAAFLLPGVVVAALAPLLAPDIWNPGHLTIGPGDFIVLTLGMSLAGAIFGSPVIVGALLIWRLLYRLRRASCWAFASLGLLAGGAFGLLFLVAAQFSTWGYFITFSLSGILTGLLVWAVAYGGPTNSKKRLP